MGFWKTLGKIGAIAAPIVAAPFTGGASLALIGAGAGAASGALNGGGWKGTLLGAGLGGATAGLAGGAGGAAAGEGAGMNFGSALSKIGKNLIKPENIAAIGSTLGGAAKGSADQRIAETPGQIGAYNANLNALQLGDRRAALASLLGGGLQDVHIGRPDGSTIPTFGHTGGLRPSAMDQAGLLKHLSSPIAPLEMPKAGLGEKIMGGIGLGSSILGQLGQLAGQNSAAKHSPIFDRADASKGVPSMPWTMAGNGLVDPATYGGQRMPGAMY